MVITDVQERIMDVFSRATNSLSEEIQKINKVGLFQQRIPLYEKIEMDFKSYSSLAKDLLTEINTNLESGLRPTEKEKYITNLNARQLIIIQDPEGDIYQQFCLVPDQRTHLLIRAKANRLLANKTKLFKQLTHQPLLGTFPLKPSGDKRRKTTKCTATLEPGRPLGL